MYLVLMEAELVSAINYFVIEFVIVYFFFLSFFRITVKKREKSDTIVVVLVVEFHSGINFIS